MLRFKVNQIMLNKWWCKLKRNKCKGLAYAKHMTYSNFVEFLRTNANYPEMTVCCVFCIRTSLHLLRFNLHHLSITVLCYPFNMIWLPLKRNMPYFICKVHYSCYVRFEVHHRYNMYKILWLVFRYEILIQNYRILLGFIWNYASSLSVRIG